MDDVVRERNWTHQEKKKQKFDDARVRVRVGAGQV